ncbi:hypothetical protein E1B28_005119 [Marasmius oreades]|uniref:Uncharacterized protein n=1 Tax=Marasmius oreades TaxID=181124 RepID=A0A9P8ADZ6_9AGAR|nr:uncharacterized protein E1B28_005119 [Marasmius oreades]KAG7097800.1 hypothetical protein E1B28_005119 [Marasmius oreades]
MSTNNNSSASQESLLFAPMIDVSEAVITPMMLANPYSSKQLPLLRALGESISSLQVVVDEKNSDVERLKHNVKVHDARVEVGKKILEIHRKAAVDSHGKAQTANHEILVLKRLIQSVGQQDVASKQEVVRLKEEVSVLKQKIGELNSQADCQQQLYTGLVHKASSLAREALRGSKLRAEILSSFAHKNIPNNRARIPECNDTICCVVNMVDNCFKLLDQIKKASQDIVGNISESSVWDRNIRKSTHGYQVPTIHETFARIRAFNPTIQWPFTVNAGPVWLFLGNRSSSDGSATSVSYPSTGMPSTGVSDWSNNISVVSNGGGSQ